MAQRKKREYPVFYLLLYQKICERAIRRQIISHFRLMEAVGMVAPVISKHYRYIMVKELEKLGLIKKVDQRKYVITGGSVDNHLRSYEYLLWKTE